MASNAKNLAEYLNNETTSATADIADGSITTAKLADGGVTTAKVADNAVTSAKALNLGRRNLAINGDMRIAQRGVGPTQAGNGDYVTVDRIMHWSYPTGTGTFTSTQSTGHQLQTGHDTAFKVDVTAADTSIGAADYYEFLQRIEGRNLQHLRWGTASAKKLQVSFWVRATKTGVNALFCSKQGTGQDYRNVIEYTINASDTWEHKTVEIPALTASTIANDDSTYVQIGWPLAMGSNFHNGTAGTWGTGAFYSTANSVNHMDSTSNDFYITGLQVEVGDTATDFEHRSYAEEQAACQRYFYRVGETGGVGHAVGSNFAIGAYYTASDFRAFIDFPVTMRANPTLTSSSVTDAFRIIRSNGSDYPDSIADAGGSALHGKHLFTNDDLGSASNGDAGVLIAGSTSSAFLNFDAEL